MSPDTIEAVRCALQTVCETGGTMDELALIEQADRIADLEQQLAEYRKLAKRLWTDTDQGFAIKQLMNMVIEEQDK